MCSSFALIIDSNICFREFLVKRWSLKQQRFEELFNVGTTYRLGSNTKKKKIPKEKRCSWFPFQEIFNFNSKFFSSLVGTKKKNVWMDSICTLADSLHGELRYRFLGRALGT